MRELNPTDKGCDAVAPGAALEEEVSIRLLRKDELREAVALADQVFRQDGRRSMGASLPKVFSSSLQQGIGCFHKGRLVSYAGMVPVAVRVGSAQLSAYSYGAVCTAAEYRGRGYASRILAYAKRYAEQSGASLLFISGELPLYLEAGFRYFGPCISYTFRFRTDDAEARERADVSGSELGIRELEAADWLRLYRLARQRPIAFEQSVWDLADLIEAGSMAAIRRWEQRVLLLLQGGVEAGFIVLAYGMEGERRRLRGQVMEWSGPLELVSAALERLMRSMELAQVTLYADAKECGKVAVSASVEVSSQAIANAGTVRVSHPQQLFAELAPYWREQGIDSERLPSIERDEGGTVRIVAGDLRSRPLGQAELADFIFGEGGAVLHEEDGELRERLGSYVPVPLPYTKGLNFV